MAYDNIIDRSGAVAHMPEDASLALIKEVTDVSLALTAFEDFTMSRGQTRMPVVSALPIAYFVGADTGQKQTTQENWKNKYLNAEEIACIVPIPEAVVEDIEGDIWAKVEPKVKTAIARVLDQAVIFGEGAPATFPTDIVDAAKTAGNEVTRTTASVEEGSLATDISNLMGKVEEDGFDIDFWAGNITIKSKIRNARDKQGQKLADFDPDGNTLFGSPLIFPAKGTWPSAATGHAELIGIEKDQYVIGLRTDIEMKLLDQAVIQDQNGKIIFNLAQEDMVALRVRFRAGWEVSNQINYQSGSKSETERYAAGVLLHP